MNNKPIEIKHKYESYAHESLLGVTTHKMHSFCEEDVECDTLTHVAVGTKFNVEKFQMAAAENNAKKIKADVYAFRLRQQRLSGGLRS